MSLGFGHLARIGHLYPSGGLCDYEIQLMAPDGVQFLTTRLPFRNTGIADDLGLVENLEQHARLLADADVDVIAVNCTAVTLLVGRTGSAKRPESTRSPRAKRCSRHFGPPVSAARSADAVSERGRRGGAGVPPVAQRRRRHPPGYTEQAMIEPGSRLAWPARSIRHRATACC
ncbi:hypothetical protein WJ438_22660 [Streptomyces sp. GD-15H]|uniref:hypothetical protein n=1 Tax=Streptomyces sp. GD-15H TaxID=3129112 RepID=UPI00325062C5